MTSTYRVLGLAAVRLGFAVMLVCAASAETSSAEMSASGCSSPYKKQAIPADRLRAIVRSHSQWLEQWYDGGQRANLYQSELRQAALNGTNLERANLEGAVLRHANLYQSLLIQASLAGADLTRARLEDSNLSGADARKAQLSHANLFRAIGDEAALFNAVLIGAQLH